MNHEVRSCICWSAAAAAVFIGCFFANVGSAWLDGPAGVGQLLVTAFYAAFWAAFSFVSRSSGILLRVAFAASLITFIASVGCLMYVLFGGGEIVMVLALLMAPFSAVPMYGLRAFLSWEQLYAAAAVFSLGWFVWASITQRKQRGK